MRAFICVCVGVGLICAANISRAATAVATYEFQNNFNADEAGVPALTVVDPLSESQFVTDTVEGSPRTVWQFNGNATPAQQAGFMLSAQGLANPEDYSVDMLVEFTQRDGAWRRLLDVQNRASDNGFYVDPSNNLDIYPVSGSTAGWTNNVFHHIVLTDNGSTVIAYLDGVSQFSTSTTEMNLDFDPTDNPNQLLGFFLDNTAGGGQGEWSEGEVALARLWNGVLTPVEAQALANNPFLPEPASVGLLLLGGAAMLSRHRRAKAA
jgi:hypothetical protein